MKDLIKNYIKKIGICILALLSVISIDFNISLNSYYLNRFGEGSVIYIALFVIMVYVLNKVIKIKDKRMGNYKFNNSFFVFMYRNSRVWYR